MKSIEVTINVNGTPYTRTIPSRLLLVHFLRDEIDLTGTHIGCDTTHCGACTILIDDKSVKSCTMLAVQADGRQVKTIEGMAEGGQMHPLQEGFHMEHGLQCGFCTPGMIMRAAELLEKNPDPTEEEIRWGISGNLCRCTGYVNIVKAVQYAAKMMHEKEPEAV